MNLGRILYSALLAVVVGGIFFLPAIIKINQIECVSQFGPCKPSLEEALARYRGASLKKAKKETMALLKAQTFVREFSFRFKLPSILAVSVLEKKPRFAVKAVGEEIYAAIDGQGEVLSIGPETNLPFVIISSKAFNLGEKVSSQILFALRIQERLYSSYQARNGEITGESLKVYLPDGLTVLFPLEGEIIELLGALSLIIYELNTPSEGSRIERERRITTIDLRFANPVLR